MIEVDTYSETNKFPVTKLCFPLLRTVFGMPQNAVLSVHCLGLMFKFLSFQFLALLLRLFFAFGQQDNSGREPQFAVSIEGTLVYSLDQGWSGDPENAYKDSLAHVVDGAATVCFHSSGHGNPAIASIEVLQIYSNAYRREFNTSSAFIWRTVKRVSAGADKSGFGSDFSADPWGGDRYWETDSSLFLPGSRVTALTTPQNISLTNIYPNVYPMAIFQSATTTTTTNLLQSLSYTLPVQPNMNYSLWIYLAEISQYVTQPQQRVFDILVNDLKIFSAVDIVVLAGGPYKAYILNTTVMVEGRTLTLKFSPLLGPILVNAFEMYELIPREASTLGSNGKSLFFSPLSMHAHGLACMQPKISVIESVVQRGYGWLYKSKPEDIVSI